MKIEVFKTNVSGANQANDLKELLQQHFPHTRINFDLHDCDRILRLEGPDFSTDHVVLLAKGKGIACYTAINSKITVI